MLTPKLLTAMVSDAAGDLAGYELDELIPDKQFCADHNIGDRTSRQWRETGESPEYVRVGRAIFYRRSAIKAWHDRHTYPHRAAEAVARA